MTDPAGYTQILLIVDHFTKYRWGVPVKDKQAGPVADALYRIFSVEGSPERWHSDNGREFVNACMDLCQQQLEIVGFSHGAPYNPRCQGLVERGNGTVKAKIMKVCLAEGMTHRDTTWPWVDKLARAMKSENDAVCKTYNNAFCPFVMLRKRPSHQDGYTIKEMDPDAVQWMYDQMITCQHKAMDKANKLAHMPLFHVGDTVRVRAKQAGMKKRNCVAVYSAMATVHGFGNHGDAFVRLKWITAGLSNEDPGCISSRMYFAGNLKLVAKNTEKGFVPQDPAPVLPGDGCPGPGTLFSVQAYWFGRAFWKSFAETEGLPNKVARTLLFFVAKVVRMDESAGMVFFRVPDDSNEYGLQKKNFEEWQRRWKVHGSPGTDGYYIYNGRLEQANRLRQVSGCNMTYVYEARAGEDDEVGRGDAQVCAFAGRGPRQDHGPVELQMCCSGLCATCALSVPNPPVCVCTETEALRRRCKFDNDFEGNGTHARPVAKECCYFVCAGCMDKETGDCNCGGEDLVEVGDEEEDTQEADGENLLLACYFAHTTDNHAGELLQLCCFSVCPGCAEDEDVPACECNEEDLAGKVCLYAGEGGVHERPLRRECCHYICSGCKFKPAISCGCNTGALSKTCESKAGWVRVYE